MILHMQNVDTVNNKFANLIISIQSKDGSMCPSCNEGSRYLNKIITGVDVLICSECTAIFSGANETDFDTFDSLLQRVQEETGNANLRLEDLIIGDDEPEIQNE
ncbi:hypothetical protein PPL_09663 [Heterostelium album PN500]|uniref:Uncharacterized protein n=1 Tax=Heterostelium pallidum (strain ATCC 26659 / Pp 5 / PN500) TaxID=670386 RepID=D3BNG0_HETP5|nr:hypothetical protein PPL_09663 [Heterostelium album PN500]EFA76911.1 hypothetical protein PPL_09663 [Heterostelium album PN500]|eukprot:XP_020429043.1 hypothetical protein PPL_09663 [Heterostelium album PN500]